MRRIALGWVLLLGAPASADPVQVGVIQQLADGGAAVTQSNLVSADGTNVLLVSGSTLGTLKQAGESVHEADKDSCGRLADAGEPVGCFGVNGQKTLAGLTYAFGSHGAVSFDLDGGTAGSGGGSDAGAADDEVTAAIDDAAKQAHMKPPGRDPALLYAGDQALLPYDSDGNPVLLPLPQVDEDDTVTVVVVDRKKRKIESLEVTKCGAAPAVRVGGTIPQNLIHLTGAERGTAPARDWSKAVTVSGCSADDGIEVAVTVAGAQKKTISIKTLPLYRLTVAVGLLYDFTRVVDYRADTVKGESVPSIVEDNHAAGVNVIALVSLRVCKTDTQRSRWEASWLPLCRMLLNPTIGLSLSDPAEHLYVANNFEPYPGLGIVVGYHFFQRKFLADGYSPGDRFTGGGTVPVDKRWTASGVPQKEGDVLPNLFIGLAVDSSVLASLLGALNR